MSGHTNSGVDEGQAMKIHFCDLCNESVPEGDLSTGKAFLRAGRVVCVTCDALMSGANEPGGAIPPVAGEHPAQHAGHHPARHAATSRSVAAHVPAPARRSGGGTWVGLVALAFAVLAAWFFSDELSRVQGDQEALSADLGRGLTRLETDVDEFSQRARGRSAALEMRLQEDLNSTESAIEAAVASLREDFRTASSRMEAIESGVAQLSESLRESEEGAGRRLDDLMAQAMKSRKEFEGLSTRLEQTETLVAAGAMVAPAARNVAAEPVRPPRFAAELADLVSTNAGTRWNAVQALGETGDPDVVPHLIPILKDPDVFVRMAVARVFGDLGAPEAVEPLIGALEDEEPVVREAAMAGLHLITGRDFDFDPSAKPADRERKVKAWRQWWNKARDEYFGNA